MNENLKVAFLGDSVTEGCFELFDCGESFDTVRDPAAVYHEKLKELWAKRTGGTLTAVNYGKSGEGTAQALKRIDEVANCDCGVVSVCLGLNDVCGKDLKRYCDNLTAIFDILQRAGKKVVFLTPNMMNTYVDDRVLPRARETAILTARMQNEGVFDSFLESAKGICAEKRIPVADAYAKWKALREAGADVTSLLSNGINHPTREMHRLFAECLYPVLREI